MNPMSYDECLAAMDLKRRHNSDIDEIARTVLTEKTNMIKEFSPLLMHVINLQPNKLISSEDLNHLWFFFCIGTSVRSIQKIVHTSSDYDLVDLTRLGQIVACKIMYDRCYELLQNQMNSKYNELFKDNDITNWYDKAIHEYSSLSSFFKDADSDSTLTILNQVCKELSNPNNDPVRQY